MSSLIWVGYMGPTDVDTKDHAKRKFKLSEVLSREALEHAVAAHGRLDDVVDAVGGLELEVHAALVTENTNGATCANAWVGAPETFEPSRIPVGGAR